MKIVITGGAGFIASHIADAYLSAGHKVVIIDNLLTGSRKNVNPKAKFYKADIRDLALMERIFKKERPQTVNHQAAIASVAASMKNGTAIFDTNTLGTTNVLLASGALGVTKFILASSCAVYGDSNKLPVSEEAPLAPLSPYGLSKVLAETMVEFYARQFGFDYIVFRPANVYGPRQRAGSEGGVVAILQDLMRKNIRPPMFGDGTHTRDYVFVEDIARANLLALSRGRNIILNLGAGRETNDTTIFRTVAKGLSFTKPPRSAPLRQGDIHRSALDGRRAKRVLGWTAKVTLSDGIRRTLAPVR